MCNDNLFAASFLKLQRAEQFIDELAVERQRYLDSKPVTAQIIGALFGEDTKGRPRLRLHFAAIGLMPGAIIGDCLHNMRTALDLMASELARINGKSDGDVYFPFAPSADQLNAAISKRRFDKAGVDAVALLKQFAPYKGGNDALRAIHDLDIRDKHTALVPSAQKMTIDAHAEFNLDAVEKGSVKLVPRDMAYHFPDHLDVFGGKPVVETLKQLVQLVHGILKAFEALVRARDLAAGESGPMNHG